MLIRHIELKEANAFVSLRHRHHKPVAGHRFSLGCYHDGTLCGVADCRQAEGAQDQPIRHAGGVAALYCYVPERFLAGFGVL